MPSDLDRVADELYGLVPGEFTAARDARAAEARQGGDRPLAAAIKALRRPTVAAWLANWLSRQEAEQLGRLLDLGAAMRSAQDHLEGEQLRQLSRQRHQVVAALGAQARRAALEAGLTVGEGALRELEDALNAALADDEAADTIRAGRLTTAGQHAAFGLADAVRPVASSPTPGPAPSKPGPAPSKRGDDELASRRATADGNRRRDKEVAAEEEAAADEQRQKVAAERRRQIEEAEQDLANAEALVDAKRHDVDEGQRIVVEARSRHEQLRQSIRDLEAQLDDLRDEESEARVTLRSAEQSRAEAEGAVEAAEDHLGELRRRLDQMRSS